MNIHWQFWLENAKITKNWSFLTNCSISSRFYGCMLWKIDRVNGYTIVNWTCKTKEIQQQADIIYCNVGPYTSILRKNGFF